MRREEIPISVRHFMESAHEFCRLIEGREKYKLIGFIEACAPLLATLYQRATDLPEISEISENHESTRFTTDQWRALFGNLSEYFGKHDHYLEVYDPVLINEAEASGGSLADDLADVYRDLKNGFLEIESQNGLVSNDVIWEWKFSFGTHWGIHLTSALRVFHSLRYSHLEDENG